VWIFRKKFLLEVDEFRELRANRGGSNLRRTGPNAAKLRILLLQILIYSGVSPKFATEFITCTATALFFGVNFGIVCVLCFEPLLCRWIRIFRLLSLKIV